MSEVVGLSSAAVTTTSSNLDPESIGHAMSEEIRRNPEEVEEIRQSERDVAEGRIRWLDEPRIGTLLDAEICHRCGGENVSWHAPSPLWNFVMRSNSIEGNKIWGDLVCMRCFVVLAEEAGVTPPSWRITADPEPEGLVYTTPDGRVWNAETFRWEPTP